jgi:hypothetical protein
MKWFRKNKTGIYSCNLCDGKGRVPVPQNDVTCPKCKGTGKLDWVENVVGKKDPSSLTFTTNYNKLLTLTLQPHPRSIKQFLSYIYSLDIFIQTKRFSIPFLKSIIAANLLVWIALFLKR